MLEEVVAVVAVVIGEDDTLEAGVVLEEGQVRRGRNELAF